MQSENVAKTIVDLFIEKEAFADIGLDDDYFDKGISSLTIIELQVKVEEVLGVSVPTAQLMRLSTINEWVEKYSTALAESA